MEDLLVLPEEYRKRQGIETGYRDAKRAMPRTTSRNDSIRLALFFFGLVISNIWVIVRSGYEVTPSRTEYELCNNPRTGGVERVTSYRSGDDSKGIKLVVLLAYMISSYVNDAKPCKPPDLGEG